MDKKVSVENVFANSVNEIAIDSSNWVMAVTCLMLTIEQERTTVTFTLLYQCSAGTITSKTVCLKEQHAFGPTADG